MASKVLLLFLLYITYAQSIDDCVVTYTEQPPSDLSCNPYATHLDPPQIFTRFACRVESTMPLDNFRITWFRESLDGSIQELQCSVIHLNTPMLQRCLLDITGDTEPANYWCQASYTVGGIPQVLARSNEASIERPAFYSNLPRCDGTNSVMITTCADQSAISQPETTTSNIVTTASNIVTTDIVVEASQTKEITLSVSKSSATQLKVITSLKPKETNPSTETSSTATYTTIVDDRLVTYTPIPPASTKQNQVSSTTSMQTSSTDKSTSKTQTNTATTFSTVTEATPSTKTAVATSDTIGFDNTDSLLSNGQLVVSLFVIVGVLFVTLVVVISLLITLLLFYKRKIRHFQNNKEIQDVKAKLREQNLESSFGSQEKYVYPITAGIYAIPSSEESRSTSQAKSDDSGRGSQESYQSLLCTNMEYTSIYSIPNMQNFNTSTTSKV